ncbi:MAG: hypothetical protein DRJ42_30655 [Deltaproteobacteria bacterium]|nr:MAG: hypothetical protein DRJ42_30655 [Deltaproteobacteria bacterium]
MSDGEDPEGRGKGRPVRLPVRLPGRLRRTFETAKLGSSVGSSYLRGRIADAFRTEESTSTSRAERDTQRHLENAKRALQTMTEVRGPLMKIGQLLTMQTNLVPRAWADELGSLLEDAPPLRYEAIREVIEEDLGGPVEELFGSFDTDAVAAASLGQVYRARLPDGTDVAVKVQYPGASAAVDGDMRNIELAATMAKGLLSDLLGQKRLDVSPMTDELAEQLRQETDYCREAYNAKLLGALFEDDPFVVVPRVHDSHSSLRVITYDWMEGDDIGTALESESLEIRERTVRQLVHAFWRQMFGAGVLHADPHPGNYRVLPDGRLGLLDYGCVKVFSDDFLRGFGDMVLAQLDGDDQRLKAAMLDLGLLEDPDDEAGLDDVRRIANYCSAGLTGGGEFDFAHYRYEEEGRALVLHFLSRRTPPPSQGDFLFLTRVVLGYYEYFSRARACMDFSALVRPYLGEGFRGREIVIPPYG